MTTRSATAVDHEPWSRLLIDGDLQDSASGETFPLLSPVDGAQVGVIAAGDSTDVDAAVAVARHAQKHRHWASDPTARQRALRRYAELVREHAEELAGLVTLETGKALSSARGEAGHAAATLDYYANAIDAIYGEIAPTPSGELGLVTRTQMGVVAAITPWNYPLMMPAWKLGPALAAGNSVILKPAEQSPLSGVRLAALGLEAGIPPGVIAAIPGLGPAAGAALGRHDDVDAVAFTGSTEVGQLFLGYAGASNIKAISLECGGKSPHVILSTPPDLDELISTVAAGIFNNAGQMCDAGSRLVVHEDLADAVEAGIVRAADEWAPGDPRDASTRVGAIIDEKELERVLGVIDRAVMEGARLATGGGRAEVIPGGSYLQPTVLAEVDPLSEAAQEEIFGPVLIISTFRHEEEAVELANGTRYGLAAAVWTRDLAQAARVSARIEAGSVFINGYDRAGLGVPFGGHRRSGLGVDRSLHAIDKYTRLKTTWIHW